MVRIEHEASGLQRQFRCLEQCCFCDTPTPYWHTQKDVAVCEGCAPNHNESEVPTKIEWCARQRKNA